MDTLKTEDLLGWMARRCAQDADDLALARHDLLRSLRSAGVAEIVADYDGCGDSGNIDGITLTPVDIEPSTATEGRIADFAWAFVAHRHPGFEINEGGCGELRWDLARDLIRLDHAERHLEVTYICAEDL